MVKAKPLEFIPYENMSPPEKLEYLKNEYGVDETGDLFELVCSLFVAARKAKTDDNKITTSDIKYMFKPASLLMPAINGFEKIPLEMKDEIVDEEFAQLVSIVVRYGILPEEATDTVLEILDILEKMKRVYLYRFVKRHL